MLLKWSVRRRVRAIVFVLVFIKYLRFKEHFYSSKSRECWKAARLLIIHLQKKNIFEKNKSVLLNLIIVFQYFTFYFSCLYTVMLPFMAKQIFSF